MGGSLLHGKEFRVRFFQSTNGKLHYEVVPQDGDYDFISYSTWRKIKEYCATLGVPEDVWPDFTQYDDTIDVPIELIHEKQEQFREAMQRLPPEAQSFDSWLAKIIKYAANGDVMFYC